jgi:hypothetical protein
VWHSSREDDKRAGPGRQPAPADLYLHLAVDDVEELVDLVSVQASWRSSAWWRVYRHDAAVLGAAIAIVHDLSDIRFGTCQTTFVDVEYVFQMRLLELLLVGSLAFCETLR